MGHRRFLPFGHRWRSYKVSFKIKVEHREAPVPRRNKVSFNNKVEHKEAPVSLSGGQVLQQYESFEQVTFGRATCKKRKQHEEDNRWHNWRKKSLFLIFCTSLHCL